MDSEKPLAAEPVLSDGYQPQEEVEAIARKLSPVERMLVCNLSGKKKTAPGNKYD